MNLNIAYVVADLKRVGPTNQTLNIIKNSKFKNHSIVITLFDESNDSMIKEYKDNNIEIICLNLNRITFMINGKKKLKELLEKNNIDIVHSYGVKPDCLCNKVCKKSKIKHIITLRNYPKEDILTRMNYIKGRIALHNHLKALIECNNVVCCSKTIYEKMSKDYPNKKFSYIQNGVDTQKYNRITKNIKEKLRKEYSFDNNLTIYISTGSFIPRKRIEETIQGYLKSNTRNSILLLVGDGFLFDEIKNKYNKNKNIVFYGKTDKVFELLQLSDVFISSSESEGLPNGVIEAVSCGLPVILSDIPQHKEIICELPNIGKIYKLGNIKQLAKCISDKNINNSDEIKNSPFTMTSMGNNYVNYYEQVGSDV